MSQSKISQSLLALKACVVFGLALCGCLLTSCPEQKTPEVQNHEKQKFAYLPFVSILNKTLLASETLPTQILLVQNEKKLQEITAKINAIETDSFGKIDFSRDLLVCIFAGNRPSTGYRIHVDSVRRNGNEISLFIREVEPEPHQIVEDAETIPLEMILLEKAILAPEEYDKIYFRLTNQQGNELTKAIYSP